MATEQGKTDKVKISKGKIALIGLVFVLVGVLVGFAFFKYAFFKARAEGIAIGYEKAAASAYQMGRPIPNNIFEEENYRVEVTSPVVTLGQPMTITINVRDKYTNITHYARTSTITAQGATSTSIQSTPPENK